MDAPTISRIERGHRKLTYEQVSRLASAMGLELYIGLPRPSEDSQATQAAERARRRLHRGIQRARTIAGEGARDRATLSRRSIVRPSKRRRRDPARSQEAPRRAHERSSRQARLARLPHRPTRPVRSHLDSSQAPALHAGGSLVRPVPETGLQDLTHLQSSGSLKKTSEAAPKTDATCPKPPRLVPSPGASCRWQPRTSRPRNRLARLDSSPGLGTRQGVLTGAGKPEPVRAFGVVVQTPRRGGSPPGPAAIAGEASGRAGRGARRRRG